MKILCIDPGFRALGLVVYSTKRKTILTWGAIKADLKEYNAAKKEVGASNADALFIERIGAFLNKQFSKHPTIKRVFVELPHGGQNFRSVKLLNQVAGLIIGWATARKIALIYYTPERNKKCVTGDNYASKPIMEIAVRKRWPLLPWSTIDPKEIEHICDAAGLIIAALQMGDL